MGMNVLNSLVIHIYSGQDHLITKYTVCPGRGEAFNSINGQARKGSGSKNGSTPVVAGVE